MPFWPDEVGERVERYTVAGVDCHVILSVSGVVVALEENMGVVENGCWGLDMLPDFCDCRPDSSLFAESRLRAEFLSLANCCCLVPAIGNDSPRSLPLLATPTPHVNVVLYPAQSFPFSKHGVQYGLFLSQLAFSWVQVKQSFAAPVVGARRRFLRGVTGSVAADMVGCWTSGTDIAIEVSIKTRNAQCVPIPTITMSRKSSLN